MTRHAPGPRVAPLVVLAVLLPLVGPAGGAAADGRRRDFTPGAVDVGDPYEPGLGNGGYDALHYDVAVDYRPATGRLSGHTTVTARATQDLSRFDLDFALTASEVSVDGVAAEFRSRRISGDNGIELEVTPATGIPDGATFTVDVTYAGTPASVTRNGYSPWSDTPTGITCWNDPDPAAQWWLPLDEHPSDKATFDVAVTAPADRQAISNGVRLGRTVTGSRATTRWRSAQPLSPHLVFLTIGRYRLERGRAVGVPAYYFFEKGSGLLGRARPDVLRTPRVLSFLQRQLGPYPFDAAGGIVFGWAFPTAFETQTKPTYAEGVWLRRRDNVWVVVHENAHQWFGDDVTFGRWRYVWLSEGFATYAEWLWSQETGEGSAQRMFLATYRLYSANPDFWAERVDRPYYPLSITVYDRGAMTLQALRNVVGTRDFFRIIRTWARERSGGNGTTARFRALAERVSGRSLDRFFHVWLERPRRPAPTVSNGFPADARAALKARDLPVPTRWAPPLEAPTRAGRPALR
ncbi:MAG: M1 family metallopeptidase [Nocardioidaceae bacterium]